VYGEVVPRVQHLSRYGGIDCFGMAQHIAQLDALNHQAKEGRRKRRYACVCHDVCVCMCVMMCVCRVSCARWLSVLSV
jgi:hypothetical protein